MKWPYEITLIRHDVSVYNELKAVKQKDAMYKNFVRAFEKDHQSEETRELAKMLKKRFKLPHNDPDSPLADIEGRRAFETGRALKESIWRPDVIFVSPYQRTLSTLEHLTRGWPALAKVKVVEEERVRERDHGVVNIYRDWKIFETFHPEQKELYETDGRYWYRPPQGESMPDVRERNRSFMSTVIRDFAEQRVMVVTHHLNILAIRANLERLDAAEFIRLDEDDKPINCGVTRYIGDPHQGSNGRLLLKSYNEKLYS